MRLLGGHGCLRVRRNPRCRKSGNRTATARITAAKPGTARAVTPAAKTALLSESLICPSPEYGNTPGSTASQLQHKSPPAGGHEHGVAPRYHCLGSQSPADATI